LGDRTQCMLTVIGNESGWLDPDCLDPAGSGFCRILICLYPAGSIQILLDPEKTPDIWTDLDPVQLYSVIYTYTISKKLVAHLCSTLFAYLFVFTSDKQLWMMTHCSGWYKHILVTYPLLCPVPSPANCYRRKCAYFLNLQHIKEKPSWYLSEHELTANKMNCLGS